MFVVQADNEIGLSFKLYGIVSVVLLIVAFVITILQGSRPADEVNLDLSKTLLGVVGVLGLIVFVLSLKEAKNKSYNSYNKVQLTSGSLTVLGLGGLVSLLILT